MTDFASTKKMFHLPEGVIYLDGNSLGALPKAAADKVNTTICAEWGEMLIGGWNNAGWMAEPSALGNRIGRLIGAAKDSVVIGDTLSIKVYQALASALELAADTGSDRTVVLSDNGNFPTDLYMADGLLRSLNRGYQLKTVDPETVETSLDETIAVLMLTEVDYRTGRKHDMLALTQKAQALGIVVIWDLAHSAGAIPVDLSASNCEFAVGCTYKYLNGGPGAPAFIYVRPDLAEEVRPALSGWLGHEAPFAFDLTYQPGRGIERMRVGTPPVLQMAALSASMDIWDTIDMKDIRRASIELCDQFIQGVEAKCDVVTLASPRIGAERGSQVSFRFEDGYAAMQALIHNGVIGDFRAPDIMRFGFTPLYVSAEDVEVATKVFARVINEKLYDRAQFHRRAAVT